MSPDVRNGIKPPLSSSPKYHKININWNDYRSTGGKSRQRSGGTPLSVQCCISSHPVKTGPKLVLRASRAHNLLGEPSQCFVTLRASCSSVLVFKRSLCYFNWSPASLVQLNYTQEGKQFFPIDPLRPCREYWSFPFNLIFWDNTNFFNTSCKVHFSAV